MGSIERRDRYLVEITSYILGERVALKTDEIDWRFH